MLKKVATVALSVLSIFGTLKCTSAVNFEDIKSHVSEHKWAYCVGGSLSAVAITFLLLYPLDSSSKESFEEDDDDGLGDIGFSFVKN